MAWHCTEVGRVVYDRARKKMGPKDVKRILKTLRKMPETPRDFLVEICEEAIAILNGRLLTGESLYYLSRTEKKESEPVGSGGEFGGGGATRAFGV